MLTIRGVYDGKTIKPLPDQPLPKVEGEIPVVITFSDLGSAKRNIKAVSPLAKRLLESARLSSEFLPPERRLSRAEAARRMDERRKRIGPIRVSVTELIHEGRRQW